MVKWRLMLLLLPPPPLLLLLLLLLLQQERLNTRSILQYIIFLKLGKRIFWMQTCRPYRMAMESECGKKICNVRHKTTHYRNISLRLHNIRSLVPLSTTFVQCQQFWKCFISKLLTRLHQICIVELVRSSLGLTFHVFYACSFHSIQMSSDLFSFIFLKRKKTL